MRNRMRRVSAAAEATDDRHSFLSGTALRCTPFHHTSPGRGPGLTENGSALRTNTPSAPSQMRYYTGDVFSQPRPADLTARADRHLCSCRYSMTALRTNTAALVSMLQT